MSAKPVGKALNTGGGARRGQVTLFTAESHKPLPSDKARILARSLPFFMFPNTFFAFLLY